MSVFIREKKVRFYNRGDLFYHVDEVRLPVIFAFFRDLSSVVAAFMSTLGSGSVTHRKARSVTVHLRKQKCVFGSAGLGLALWRLESIQTRMVPIQLRWHKAGSSFSPL